MATKSRQRYFVAVDFDANVDETLEHSCSGSRDVHFYTGLL